ncbi:MAG: thioesterase family protein, partial [Chloroflexota bacterium]
FQQQHLIEPQFYKTTVTEDHLDEMGHLNIQWYIAFYDKAAWQFFAEMGMTQTYFAEHQSGSFALQQYAYYYNEVRLGETITIHTRLLGRSPKRAHFIHFMLNQTRSGLAATLETLSSHADLKARRTSPFPPDIAKIIDKTLSNHRQLNWDAPTCGIMRA